MVGNMVKVDQGKSVNMVEWEQMHWIEVGTNNM